MKEFNGWEPRSRVLMSIVPIVLGQSNLGYDPALGVVESEDI